VTGLHHALQQMGGAIGLAGLTTLALRVGTAIRFLAALLAALLPRQKSGWAA